MSEPSDQRNFRLEPVNDGYSELVLPDGRRITLPHSDAAAIFAAITSALGTEKVAVMTDVGAHGTVLSERERETLRWALGVAARTLGSQEGSTYTDLRVLAAKFGIKLGGNN